MTVRAKLQLISQTESHYNRTAKVLKFQAVYDEDTPENIRFQKYTPSASAEFTIDNPAAIEQFELGKFYYVDFTEVS